jgi:hypothetical protein
VAAVDCLPPPHPNKLSQTQQGQSLFELAELAVVTRGAAGTVALDHAQGLVTGWPQHPESTKLNE